jgi:hypothetical protein
MPRLFNREHHWIQHLDAFASNPCEKLGLAETLGAMGILPDRRAGTPDAKRTRGLEAHATNSGAFLHGRFR